MADDRETKIFVEIEKALKVVMKLKREEISLQTDLVNELGMESIDFIDMEHEVSNGLDIDLDLAKFFAANKGGKITVQRLVDFIAQLGT